MVNVMPQSPDPRVIAVIQRALDAGVYSVNTQLALVQCFALCFQAEPGWREMIADDPEIAALVRIASQRTLH